MLVNKQFLKHTGRLYNSQSSRVKCLGTPLSRFNFSLLSNNKENSDLANISTNENPMSLRYTVPVEDVPPAALAHENSVYSQLSDLAAEKLRESNYLSHLYVDDSDIASSLETLRPINDVNTVDVWQVLSSLTPNSIYESMDIFSRDALNYLATDLGWGMGWAIIAISVGIRAFFMPLMFSAQFNAQKMKLLEPEMKNFQNTTQRLQRSGDYEGMKQARKTFFAMRERYGINSIVPLLNLFQIPVLITWFLSLRYVAGVPDKFPGMRTDGFLWFKNLSEYDPYFVLPIISAVVSSYNISISTMNSNTSMTPMFARYTKYFRYIPFLTIPITGFFPAGINIYWAVSALMQMIVTVGAQNPAIKRMVGIPKYLPGSILEKTNTVVRPDIIKTKIIDNIDQAAANREVLEDQAQKIINAAKGKSPLKGETVEVFVHKPKKSKK